MRALCVFATLCAACSSSDSGAFDQGIDVGGFAPPTAVISATPDLVGFATRLDATGSHGYTSSLGYAWHFLQVPPASTVTDASLSSATGPAPSFDPDLGGDYKVQLTVTESGIPNGGVNGVATATVTVPTLPLFYYQGNFTASTDTFAVGVVRSDGTGARAIDCAVSAPVPDAGSAGYLLNVLEIPGFFTMRVFDAPTGGGASLAFEQVVPAGGASDFRLWLADDQSDCNARPPVRLDDANGKEHVEPRFSADGSRLVYIDRGAPDRLVTVARDGTARHVVRTSAKIPGAAPLWLDATHVAWAEDTSANSTPHLAIYSAADADAAGDGAGRATLLDCPNAATDATVLQVINQFELAGTTLVIAGGVRSKFASPAGSINLYKMAANSCSTTTATSLASQLPGGDAWDFTLAPDGKTIAMSSTAGQSGPNPQHDILLLTVDGTLTPTVYAGSDPVLDDVGPRWIAGGRQLTWTHGAPPGDGGTATGGGIMIGNLNGTHVRSLVPQQLSAQGPVLVAGGSNRGLSCSGPGRL